MRPHDEPDADERQHQRRDDAGAQRLTGEYRRIDSGEDRGEIVEESRDADGDVRDREKVEEHRRATEETSNHEQVHARPRERSPADSG